ncbi:hypothetical protein [Vibrio coralliilyticus]|uniref:hypothetical protein n=1 Tax=Vibrio coralliilyticus TaxID=190893 RepID=UPI001E3947F3|nr:hypothetical protein [Vibrio coralliilyticus]MCC2524321.1 hypothetical protein [Vibrio coralliilyticus]
MLFEQLKRPFGYLFIKEVWGKGFYDWCYPALLTLFTWVLFHFSGKTYSNLNADVISGLAAFVSNLPGFYIAALAAIATFQSDKLDEFIETTSSTTPYIEYNVVDENKNVVSKQFPLKRRSFLTYMFAFLTALSFLIVISSKLANLIPESSILLLKFYSWGIFFVFYQMVVTTFCGLYYLGSRLNE